MKEKEDENIVKELVFDEEGKEVQEDIVEELTETEKEKVIGGITFRRVGRKNKYITLKYKGQSKSFISGVLENYDFVTCNVGSKFVKVTRGSLYQTIKFERISSEKGYAQVSYIENHTLSKTYYDVNVTINCP